MTSYKLGLLLLLALPVQAADRVTATVTITNTATVNGDTFTLNGSTRTWTNSVTLPASQILTNNSIGGITSNLWFHVNATPFATVNAYWVATNRISFQGAIGQAMTVTFGGNWATNAYSTQTVVQGTTVVVPMSNYPNNVRTNVATLLVSGVDSYAQSAFSQTAAALAGHVNLGQAQNVTNKALFSATLSSPVSTNLVNRGNAISSPGSGTDSEQFGTGALATNVNALAVGQSAQAYGSSAIAIGNTATASATGDNNAAIGNFASATKDSALAIGNAAAAAQVSAVAIGASSASSGTNSVALGTSATASAGEAIAIGANSEAAHTNAIAVGYTASTTSANQIMLGTTAHTTVIPGLLQATATNSTYYGTVGLLSGGYLSAVGSTNFNATNSTFKGVFYPRSSVTSLATNGVNVALDFGIFTYIKLSALTGGDGPFSIGGIAGGSDGRWLQIENDTGQNLTIVHESAGEGTAANRIHTMTGADVATTANGFLEVIYDSADSRWKLKYLTP